MFLLVHYFLINSNGLLWGAKTFAMIILYYIIKHEKEKGNWESPFLTDTGMICFYPLDSDQNIDIN